MPTRKDLPSNPQDAPGDPDFQFVLQQLLDAWKPVLDEELRRAESAERLEQEERKTPFDCEAEIALGNRILERFFTEDVAQRLLPPEARQLLGPIDRWRWCYLHIRCCILFGWLVCRGPRTFRGFFYYLYRYWLCIRGILGVAPVGRPLTAEETEDLRTLASEAAAAWKPYLADQLASVEFPLGLPEEVASGKLDCLEGEEERAALLERIFTLDTARALLGRKEFEAHVAEPFFWFCRCWCLCAIRFGCCLARAHSLIEFVRCLRAYRECLRRCFRPIHCELHKPTGCTEEEPNPNAGGLTVTVVGTASGSFFSHYTLEIRKVEGDPCDSDLGWTGGPGVAVYPGGTPVGSAPVVNGVLGWINTTTLSPGSYEIRVCVHATQPPGSRTCCCITFNLFKKMVWIERVAGAPVATPPGPFVFDAPIVNANPGGVVVPVGCCVTVKGSAFVGECNNRKIKCVDLRYGIGFLPGPGMMGFNPAAFFGSLLAPTGPICYDPPDEALKRAPWNQIVGRALTTRFVKTTITFFNTTITVYKLQDFCFNSLQLPPCPDSAHACHSGKYTLLLDVTDTLNNHYYDTQHVWFDNKPIHAKFSGLQGLPGCSDMDLSKFVPPGAPCGTPWPMNALGIAYDEYIDPADLSYPSDNFDFYQLVITRQGGPSYNVPITPTLGPPMFGPNPLHGNSRVGDPGTRCEETIGGCPPPPHPPEVAGILTQLDLRIFDAVCAASLAPPFAPPPGFALQRGECCGYAFQLYVQDKTWDDGGPGNCHHLWTPPWAVCICNDLPRQGPFG
jgi:hypothetical protein